MMMYAIYSQTVQIKKFLGKREIVNNKGRKLSKMLVTSESE